jgi:hypothetical protein
MIYVILWKRLRDLHGVLCADAVPQLATAVEHMRTHPQEYEQFAPRNGWGNYEGALEFLTRIYEGCKRHPKCTIKISR